MLAQKLALQLLDRSTEYVRGQVSRRQTGKMKKFIADNAETPFRLTPGMNKMIMTPHGWLRLEAADGQYGGTGIFVYLPGTLELTDELAFAFKQTTDKRFVIEPNPNAKSGVGEHPKADALISAGISSYIQRWRKEGYWYTRSPAPTITMIEQVLPQLLPKKPATKHY